MASSEYLTKVNYQPQRGSQEKQNSIMNLAGAKKKQRNLPHSLTLGSLTFVTYMHSGRNRWGEKMQSYFKVQTERATSRLVNYKRRIILLRN